MMSARHDEHSSPTLLFDLRELLKQAVDRLVPGRLLAFLATELWFDMAAHLAALADRGHPIQQGCRLTPDSLRFHIVADSQIGRMA